MLDLPRSRLQPRHEFQPTFLKCTQKMLENWSGLPENDCEFGENSIMYFSLKKITEIALVFHVTHSYFQLHQLQNQDAGPFNLQWRLKTLSK